MQQASHISHMNLPTYNVRPTAQWKKQQQKMRQMLAQESCDMWKIFQSFLLKSSTYTIPLCISRNTAHFLQRNW